MFENMIIIQLKKFQKLLGKFAESSLTRTKLVAKKPTLKCSIENDIGLKYFKYNSFKIIQQICSMVIITIFATYFFLQTSEN